MSFSHDLDVVIIGLTSDAELAATAAALAGLRVGVIERSTRSQLCSTRRARLERIAPLVAGVRLGATVHELAVEDGEVVGLGYSSRCGAVVGAVRAPSVVLALPRKHWEFVGSAAWLIERSRPQLSASRIAEHPSLVNHLAADDPEFRVRRWCASRDARQPRVTTGPLVAETSCGIIRDTLGRPLPGLYTVADREDLVDFTRSLVVQPDVVGRTDMVAGLLPADFVSAR